MLSSQLTILGQLGRKDLQMLFWLLMLNKSVQSVHKPIHVFVRKRVDMPNINFVYACLFSSAVYRNSLVDLLFLDDYDAPFCLKSANTSL